MNKHAPAHKPPIRSGSSRAALREHKYHEAVGTTLQKKGFKVERGSIAECQRHSWRVMDGQNGSE